MAVSLFDSAHWAGHFGDPEVAAAFSDEAELRAMLRVEAALAAAQAKLGLIPEASARAIAEAVRTMPLDPAGLAAGTGASGLPVSGLVAALRAAVPDHADHVHRGATSQDIVDTGLALRLAPVLDLFESRIAGVLSVLARQAALYRDTVMAARTRAQIAVPTTLGARIASWGMPLLRHRRRLAACRDDVLVLTLGGAAGTRAALGPEAEEIACSMAEELGLSLPDMPPHSSRDGTAALAAWLALVTGTLGKIGQDLILLGQSEIGEVRSGAGGGSSAMPHKQNPVAAETLVALARANAAGAGEMLGTMVHASERDGVAWAGEWLTLPRMVLATAASLRHARQLADGLTADPDRITDGIARDRGLMMAEHAVGQLSRVVPRTQAVAAVQEACADVRANRTTLAVEMRAHHPQTDWQNALDPAKATGDAAEFADRFVRAVNAGSQLNDPAGRKLT